MSEDRARELQKRLKRLRGGASFEARSFDQIVPAERLTNKIAIREDAIWSRPAM